MDKIFDILEAWYKERKKHSDKTFKEWLKHVGGLWTSKEEWAKLGRWETWKTPMKDTGKEIGKMFIRTFFIIIFIIIVATIFNL
jgi:hypothetical protein|tara:strand:+ start:866 stop:1117 length:252 start_codon:yes stop_codon:yes gene_type:complete